MRAAIDVERKVRDALDECAQREESAVVSPGQINNEFVALCPTLMTEDRDEALRQLEAAYRTLVGAPEDETLQHAS